jgi:hypothetical protein
LAVRQEILARSETLSDLEWAAEERFREAEELLRAGHFSGAVYLFGLSCEMWLKLGCFRYRGAKITDPVLSQLGPAKAWMKIRYPLIQCESYHSLVFWVEYLIATRAASVNPLTSSAIGEARHHIVHRLFEDWKIDLRYRQVASLSERQARRVYRDAAWVRQHWNALWR